MNDLSTKPPTVADARWRPAPFSWRHTWEIQRDDTIYVMRHYLHWVLLSLLIVFVVFFTLRHDVQLLLLAMRKYCGGVMVATIIVGAVWLILRRYSVWVRTSGEIFAIIMMAVIAFFGKGIHDYVSQYLRYQTLEFTDVSVMLQTVKGKERVLPLRSMDTMARDQMNKPYLPASPDLVRWGNGSHWVMAVEPERTWGKLFWPIDELLSVPATDPLPDFSGPTSVKVHFTIGENLYLGRNTDTCVRRSFGFMQMFNYDVGNIVYLPDDKGDPVQVISLIKWTGWLFPWPEFGGVQIIPQGDTNIIGRLFGCGYWIPPEHIAKYPFLRGQNIVPYEVSRFTASSLRFQGGSNWFTRFFAPLQISRSGDVVIADVPEDMNPQPFTLDFQVNPEDPGKLYQYFAMETRDPTTHGLSTSLWYPADSQGKLYVYRHAGHQETPLGPTAIKDRVMGSHRNYQWGPNTVAEARPYIHILADSTGELKPRFLYMTTVVNFTQKKGKEGDEVRLSPGGSPEIAFTDANRGRVVWVDTFHPETWDEQLRKELGDLWVRRKP